MPTSYRRNYRRRNRGRRYYRRKYQKSRGYIYGKAANQLYRDVMSLKEKINVEYKVADRFPSGAITSTGTLFTVNGLQLGDDITNRDGRQVRWVSMQSSLVATWDPALAAPVVLRCMFIIDTQPSGTAPGLSAILDSVDVVSFRNLANRKRFVCLKDFSLTLSADYPEKVFKMYKKLNMKTVFNSGNTGTITDISSNSLYLLMVSNTSTNAPGASWRIRLRFIDN